MGKKGDMLRAQKKQRVIYTFTAEQLWEHDRQVENAYRKRKEDEFRETWDKFDQKQKQGFCEYTEKVWNKRAKEFESGTQEDKIVTWLSYLLAISARVLIERFGWTPVEGHRYSNRLRIVRFSKAVIEEIEGIMKDKNKGIQEYSVETYKLYGVKFRAEEEE